MPRTLHNAQIEIRKLREQLAEMEQVLQAIHSGEVDAVVVDGSHGPRIFTLQTQDLPYRELLEQMSEGAASISEDGTILYCNSHLAKTAGSPLENLIGTNVYKLILRSDRLAFAKLLDHAPTETHKGEIQFQRADGAVLPMLVSLRSADGGSGRTICMVAVDVTEIKARSRAKMQSLSAAVESCNEAIIALTPAGIITDWNHGAERLYGYCADEVIGTTFERILPLDKRSELRSVREMALDGGAVEPYESQRMAKDGSLRDVLAIMSPIRDEEENIIGLSSIASDLHESIKAREQIALQSAALEATANAVVITNVSGRIEWVNTAFTSLTGYQFDEAIGRNPKELVRSGAHDKAFYQEMWGTIRAGRVWSGEIINCRKSGERYFEEMTISPVRSRAGEIEHFVAVKQDISVRKATDNALRHAEERYREIFDNAIVGIFRTTADGRPLMINQALAEIHGYKTPENLMAEVHNVFRQLFVDAGDSARFVPILESEGQVRGAEIEVFRRDRSRRTLLANVRAIRDAHGSVVEHEGTLIDITERKIAEEQAQYLAYYDSLTGLPNRILIRDRIKQAIAEARRRRNRVAIAFLDLDRFKNVNDSLGHSIGDLVLQQVAHRLTHCNRDGCTIGRIGGDEFVIAMNIGDLNEIIVALNRTIESLKGEFVASGISLYLGCSVGVSVFPDNGDDVETLIKNADAAMYVAKETKCGKFQFFAPEMNASAVERLSLENGLRVAVQNSQLFILYQPQIELSTKRIVGVEALIRWQHPEMGVVSPGRFIPIAESSGLIVPIGDWVLKTACMQMRRWQESGVFVGRVAVNVSPAQLRATDYVSRLKAILEESGLSPQSLEIEITESLLMAESSEATNALSELRRLGVSLAVDDFGTGYCNLKYLASYGITKLKIDRSFIQPIGETPESAIIVRAIIQLAKNLGIEVIAEGVEHTKQWQFLKRNHCEQVQGFYFSKPIPADEVPVLLRSHEAEPLRRGQ